MTSVRARRIRISSVAWAASLSILTTCGAAAAFADPPPPASSTALTPQELAQAKILEGKILAVVAAMPASATQNSFEAAILGVTAGVPCKIVKAAIAMAGPSLSGAAAAAATAVAKACGAIGAVGQNPNLMIAPGFAPGGGGGPNYSQ